MSVYGFLVRIRTWDYSLLRAKVCQRVDKGLGFVHRHCDAVLSDRRLVVHVVILSALLYACYVLRCGA